MGLTKADIADITTAWQGNMAACQAAIVAGGGFNWQLFRTVSAPSRSACTSFMRSACRPNSTIHDSATFFRAAVQKKTCGSRGCWRDTPTPWALEHADVDLATFLLARGE